MRTHQRRNQRRARRHRDQCTARTCADHAPNWQAGLLLRGSERAKRTLHSWRKPPVGRRNSSRSPRVRASIWVGSRRSADSGSGLDQHALEPFLATKASPRATSDRLLRPVFRVLYGAWGATPRAPLSYNHAGASRPRVRRSCGEYLLCSACAHVRAHETHARNARTKRTRETHARNAHSLSKNPVVKFRE